MAADATTAPRTGAATTTAPGSTPPDTPAVPAPPAPAGTRTARLPRAAWTVPPLAVLGLLFLYPLALVVQESLAPGAYASVLTSEAFRDALVTTVLLALGATAGCLLLGFVLALVLAFVPFPGSRAVARFVDVFLSFPSFLVTLALLFLYGTVGIANGLWTDATGDPTGPFRFLTTPWGVLLAEITYFTPFVMRPLLAAFAQLDTAQLEAASSLGGRPARIVRRVILPEALPALAAGGGLVLVLSLNEFGIVLFTGAKGVTTLPTLIYGKAILESDYVAACVVAVVNVALSVGLYSLYRVVSRRAGAHR
ncbi:2-aminoethylphosphonate ABC transporter permease subunit [Streptomyces thermolilacinus]|uniref:2-aminoethylphosphonate ABC transporter permease subunit n=1 Tax=Streptomyces thermolilacinus SPC6 TaxID=1306406 RepID=A0A1D3DUW9_9ACTN|nr:2-aminoethylphosphonate ABC transporter permease subunit [Streptomyces thermolilacinus]OEJ96113.1 2-aminoethylphosphonate ABC transporter permease subunit [Streptomyces thermolilacinus SPC6]